MADTIDLDGEKFVSPSFVTSAISLDDIYTAWVTDFEGSTTAYTPSWASTDDGATLLPVPALWTGGADRLVVSTECGVEIVPYQFTSASSHYAQTIAGVSRYYSINCGLRLAIIFHPTGIDSGITSFSGNYNADLALFRGTHNRTSENVQFVARVVPGRQIDVAIKNTAQTAGLPVKLVVLNGTTVVSSTDLTTIVQGGVTLVTCSIYGGTVSGTVVDQAGQPATRIVHVHERETGSVIGRGRSDSSGLFEIPVIAKVGTTMYVVGLDDENSPLINAVIADRIVLE
ncbi:hypothetical protein ACT52I_11705 [Pseudomonas aeruginosa]|uniref:hypothetical protein n=1 Tax=Pseudomonas aeruginosa TaxID=287 RepID=UPI00372C0FA6